VLRGIKYAAAVDFIGSFSNKHCLIALIIVPQSKFSAEDVCFGGDMAKNIVKVLKN